MTPLPGMEEETAESKQVLAELLQEGLAWSESDDSTDVERFRRLFQVLVQHCLLRPGGEANGEHVDLTLMLLAKQTAQRPDLLLSPLGDGLFYSWLLSRLIVAAVRYEEEEWSRPLVLKVCEAASKLLVVLGRDIGSDDTNYMPGPSRVGAVLRELIEYAKNTSLGRLLGHDDLPSGDLAKMVALHIALQTRTLQLNHTESAALTLSDMAGGLAQLSPRHQVLFVKVTTAALGNLRPGHALSRACVAAVTFPGDAEGWDQAVIALLSELRKLGDSSLQHDVWWALHSQANDIELTTRLEQSKASYLLQPIQPFLRKTQIGAHLATAISQWAEGGGASHDLREQLRDYVNLPRTTSLKRKRDHGRSPVEDKVLALLRSKLPELDLDDDLRGKLPSALDQLDIDLRYKLLEANPIIACALAQCDNGHRPLPDEIIKTFLDPFSARPVDDRTNMRVYGILYHHTESTSHRSVVFIKPLSRAWTGLSSEDRRTRLAASQLVSALYWSLSSSPKEDDRIRAQRDIIDKLPSLFKKAQPIKETAMRLVGDIGGKAKDKALGDVLEILLKQLGSSSPLRSLANTQLIDIAASHEKQPYNLLSPYLDRVGVLLAECLVPNPDVVAETMHFIGYTRQAFFTLDAVRKAILPELVLLRNRAALETLATILGQRLGHILIDEGAAILAKVFLTPKSTDVSLTFIDSLLNEAINSRTVTAKLDKYIRASIVPLVVAIVVELGDEDPSAQDVATRALHAVQKAEHNGAGDPGDLGAFLKPHMLGVLASMTELLMAPRTAADQRRKIIRSIGKLISLVGDSMASFSPQIIASLQGTLQEPDLRLQTLRTWSVWVEMLKFSDVGPYIGPTIATLIAAWSSFDPEDVKVGKSLIAHISGNAQYFSKNWEDIVRFEHIPELAALSKQLLAYRAQWTTKMYLDNLIIRTENKNLAISTLSMRELRDVLQEKQAEILQLVRGDTFDPIIPRIVRTLLQAATRDGHCPDLRDLSYECFGLLGALDPDRFVPIGDESSMTIMSNFTDHEESITFAIHLLRDLLTGAFRGTNDTKHQKNLSFTIQELLKFCNFDSRLVNRQGSVAIKVRQRWESLPKDTLETVTPLLDAQFRQNQVKTMKQRYPIYPWKNTYREWVQAWTVDLIGRVMEMQPGEKGDAQFIFGAFNSEPKNQDVAVAHHLLPHLVLHVLLSGDAMARAQIREEIHDVLRDQVSPSRGSPEKRMLSAQMVFDLMDHLSKWLRLARADRDRSSHTRAVDALLQSIDTELAANAALKSRAFARSLRNFEERIVHLRTKEHRPDAELQTYFESLHEIYAELDEPDGMEGISASVVSPSLELQIREHESTGRWTSAQSCWEVRLQHSPEDLSLHVGLLKCLKNLGHYDTLRTHIIGVLDRHPEWATELAPFQAEAAWTIGDWDTVRKVNNPPAIANVFMAMQVNNDLTTVSKALQTARHEIGSQIKTREYARVYESVLQLHMLREVEMIHAVDTKRAGPGFQTQNAAAISRRHADELISTLSDRFQITLPSFRVREELLNKRRAAFSLVQTPRLRPEHGQAWIQSAKIARKAGYEQTAYSAALQAHEADAPFAFIQQAKLVRAQGGILKALRELEHPVKGLMHESEVQRNGPIDLTGSQTEAKNEDDFRRDRSLAKAILLEARWAHEADRFEQNDVIRRFKRATELGDTLEAPFFHLGRYYDTLANGATDLSQIAAYNHFTCVNYHEALQRGVKYIYQTMPRLLTVWLDLGENKEAKKIPIVANHVQAITKIMDRSRGKIMTYQFLTAFPQMISRITHTNKEVQEVLVKLVYRVIRDYPLQALWPTIGAVHSNKKDRRELADAILRKSVINNNSSLLAKIGDAKRLSKALLMFAEDKPEGKVRHTSVEKNYPYLQEVFPSSMILPLQDALTCVLPASGSSLKGHQAFPDTPVTIIGLKDDVEIMPSLQQPKKLVFKGSDGKRYPFLCKPHDDLRKDARLMDMNSMINGFLRSASESRRRHLYIRTYAVMPLNEECGLIEWVPNTSALKRILEEGYARHKKKVYSNDIYQALEGARKSETAARDLPKVFRDKILPMYRPTVFHEWFMLNWPEPSAWLAARTNYARTLAVMSMIGYVLGLGDRHGENILFDGLSGDTVHVDLNCLFEKAKTFEVPERVPFRLTHNMQDALGVTGVEGVYRKAAEITMTILRSNGNSLMSVLEAFVHDPLVEWASRGSRNRSAAEIRNTADRQLGQIAKKLRGVMGETETTVPNHVEALIREATSLQNLALMYVGWAAWL